MVKIANWDKLQLEEVREGVARKVFSGHKATVCINYLSPGHKPNPHSHPHEQIVYIVSGTCDFHVGDEIVPMGPGDVMVIPGDTVHHTVVTGSETLVNLDVFSPARSEYGG